MCPNILSARQYRFAVFVSLEKNISVLVSRRDISLKKDRDVLPAYRAFLAGEKNAHGIHPLRSRYFFWSAKRYQAGCMDANTTPWYRRCGRYRHRGGAWKGWETLAGNCLSNPQSERIVYSLGVHFCIFVQFYSSAIQSAKPRLTPLLLCDSKLQKETVL